MALKPPPAALMDASASHASHPLETHGVEELAVEATKEKIVNMGAVQDNFFILVIARICKKAREPLTNLFECLQKGTPVRNIDGDERQPSRLAIPVWSKADEVAAEVEELTKSEVWVDELACAAEKGFAHLHHADHADFDTRFWQKLTKRRLLQLMMICRRGPGVRYPARLHVVHSLLDEDETFLEITTLKFKSMFHTELWEVVLELSECERHISGVQSLTSLASDNGCVWNSLAKQTDWRCFLFSRRDMLQIHGSSRSSCVGCYFKNIEALCVHVSCWWTVLRVVCSSAHHVCLRFVLVISR